VSKKAYRTEGVSPEMSELIKVRDERAPITIGHPLKLDELVWYHERRDGRRYEHLARVDALHDDREATLSYTVMGELGRIVAEKVPELLRESTIGGWVKAI